MFGRPFRFIHASDLHLERVPRGLATVPVHLSEMLADAAYHASAKIFDAALAEEADFLILSGDVVNPRHAGPRAMVFLVEQFRRLHQRGIGVFWAGGRVDQPDGWPAPVRLPDNVNIFPPGRVEEFVFRHAGVPLARLLGASHDGRSKIRAVEFPAQHTQLYSIGVVHGTADPDRLSHRAVHYWALGGRHERTTLSATPHVVHYPGTPLGRSPDETGAHGCTLVQVDEQGRARLTFLPTDTLRWQQERTLVGDNTTADALAVQLREQTTALVAAAPGVNLLVSWTVSGSGPLVTKLRRGGLADELLAGLRAQFGQTVPVAWTVALEAEGVPPSEELFEQETILGDFLRAVRQFQTHSELPLDVEQFLSEPQLAGALGSAARFIEPALRDRVLREAAWLGSDLLSAGDLSAAGSVALPSGGPMKINDLQVDGFGVWTDFHVSGLDNDVNVFYGPNEAGKTTLLHFVRSILYGFSPGRRKYLPPVHGGRPGGTINLVVAHGRFSVARHNDGVVLRSSSTLAITAEDGTLQGDHFLKTLLGNVDEATFNNVFAVGLREIQELNTLSDLDAARLLYDLTSGLDRISLPDVMRELAASRGRLLAPDERSTQVGELLAQRQRLQAEIDELHALTPRYARLAGQADTLGREISDTEDETSRLRQQVRVAEIAAAVRGPWQERVALDQQIAAFRPQGDMPSNAVARLDRVNARLAERRQRCADLKAEGKRIRDEASAIEVNEALWRQTPRIEVLAEQQSWVAALEAQILVLAGEVAELEKKLAVHREQLGLPAGDPSQVTSYVSKQSLAPFKPLAAAVHQAKQLDDKAREDAAERRRVADGAKNELTAALAARSEKELLPALEKAGELVTQLRRRLQLEERLDQMARRQAELEEESHQSFDGLQMPDWTLPALAGVFAFGVILILAGLVLGHIVAGLGWLLALLGIGGTIGIGATKWFVERSAERRTTSCQKQLDLLARQTEQAREERTALDEQLPRGGGPLAARLQTAEKQLGLLEAVLPLDAKSTTAEQEAQAAGQRATQAHAEYQAARKRWRAALVAAGLPESLSPKQLRELHEHRREISDLERRLAGRREELDGRRREQAAFAARLEMVFLECDLTPASGSAVGQLKQLHDAVAAQEDSRQQKHQLLARRRHLRRQWSAHAKGLAGWKRRRRTLLRRAQAKNEEEFRCRALEHARGELLARQREGLDREIAAAMAGQCSADELGAQLSGDAQHSLDDRRTKLNARLQASQQHFATLLERRGELNQQMKTLTEDRRLSHKLLELAAVEQKLKGATSRWQVLAVTERILGSIRDEYERDRQPETLQEASHYLAQLTEGHYRRVWTPLGERVLRVDDDHGRSLPIEVLSRGTREQLFLSLRLALAASYARRGAALPLVLDDVLVNFDAGRARAAAAVLRDFAAAGHQIFLFTCHEHMAAMFQEAQAATVTLPDNSGPAHIKMSRPSPVASEPKPARKPRRRKEAAENVTLPLPRPYEEYADGPGDTEAA